MDSQYATDGVNLKCHDHLRIVGVMIGVRLGNISLMVHIFLTRVFFPLLRPITPTGFGESDYYAVH